MRNDGRQRLFFLLSCLLFQEVGGKTTSVVVLLPPPLDYRIHLIIPSSSAPRKNQKFVHHIFRYFFLNQSTFSLYFTIPMESFVSSSLKCREGWEKNGSCQKKTIWKKKFWHVVIRSCVPPAAAIIYIYKKKANGIFQEPIRLRKKEPQKKKKVFCDAALHTYWSYTTSSTFSII